MKNFKKLLVTLGAFGGLALAGTVASANSVYTVKDGDTLSEIANDNGTTIQDILNINKDITDANIISVGQQIELPTDTNNVSTVQSVSVEKPVQQSQVQSTQVSNQESNTVVETQPVQVEQTTQSSQATTSNQVTSSSDNSNKALRRQIESGGNYNTNTGNGYVGAYQFAPSTIASIESATGMKWSMNPSTQDAFADYYANQRYGGWQNVPTTGGW